MDQELKDEWAEAMNSLMEMPAEQRVHFALLLVNLAKCYADKDSWKSVVLIQNHDALRTFSVGANEAEAAEMLKLANDAVLLAATADAPPKEMFN